MILVDDVVTHLIEKLAEVYPKPATWKGIAGRVAAACPEWASTTDLDALAEKIIGSREAKTFPSVPALITLVKAIPRSDDSLTAKGKPRRRFGGATDADREKARDLAEAKAIAFLRGTEIAGRAIREQWAPALLVFVTDNGREPDPDEEEELVAKSRENDTEAMMFDGPLASTIKGFRATMHEAAARRLSAVV